MDYKVISTDDHLQEAPHTWTSRMSKAKWGDGIPQIVDNGDDTESWMVYGEPKTVFGVALVHGVLPDRASIPTRWEQVPEIAYVPSERIKAMDQDGVDVHTFFGNIAGVAGHTFQDPKYPRDYALEAIRAFNDYQIEEFATPYPGRFITIGIVPLWDVDEAIAELRRTKALGIKAITFAFPQQWGYRHIGDPYWDPFWAEAQAAGLSINLHIGSGGSMGIAMEAPPNQPQFINLAQRSTGAISANVQVMTTVLFSGVLERFPELKIVSSESGLGWVPYLLELADHQWERQKLWRVGMEIKPSDYFHRQCYVNFWFEKTGTALRHIIGIDNIMWESDFPHPTCTWPESRRYIAESMEGWTEEERRKVLVDNAVRVFNLNGS